MDRFKYGFYICREAREFFEAIDATKSPGEICKARTEICLNWYAKKAKKYKAIFFAMSLISIVVPLISTILVSYFENTQISVVLAAITSMSASMLALFNVKELWTNYRDATEYIKSQFALYCAKADPYNGKDADERYLLSLESYMQRIHVKWQKNQAEKKEGSQT